MVLFQNAIMLRKVLSDSEIVPILESETIKRKEIKETKRTKEQIELDILNNLSPNTRKVEEHKMNRNKSIDNFVKFSWSWTL